MEYPDYQDAIRASCEMRKQIAMYFIEQEKGAALQYIQNRTQIALMAWLQSSGDDLDQEIKNRSSKEKALTIGLKKLEKRKKELTLQLTPQSNRWLRQYHQAQEEEIQLLSYLRHESKEEREKCGRKFKEASEKLREEFKTFSPEQKKLLEEMRDFETQIDSATTQLSKNFGGLSLLQAMPPQQKQLLNEQKKNFKHSLPHIHQLLSEKDFNHLPDTHRCLHSESSNNEEQFVYLPHDESSPIGVIKYFHSSDTGNYTNRCFPKDIHPQDSSFYPFKTISSSNLMPEYLLLNTLAENHLECCVKTQIYRHEEAGFISHQKFFSSVSQDQFQDFEKKGHQKIERFFLTEDERIVVIDDLRNPNCAFDPQSQSVKTFDCYILILDPKSRPDLQPLLEILKEKIPQENRLKTDPKSRAFYENAREIIAQNEKEISDFHSQNIPSTNLPHPHTHLPPRRQSAQDSISL